MNKLLILLSISSLLGCMQSKESNHNWIEKRDFNSHSMLFFSGMYSASDDGATFHDCVTGCDYTIDSTDIIAQKMERAYKSLGYDRGSAVYATLRGNVELGGALDINEFLGFSTGLTCSNTPLMSMSYISGNDTLTLKNDYSYTLKVKSKGVTDGFWGRSYSDEGFLLIDSLYSVQFIINFEPENSTSSPLLIFKRLDGDREVLLPKIE